MADTKISALTGASSVADANEFAINEAGTSKKVTGSQIATYVRSKGVIAVGHPAEAKINSTTSDQDYATIHTFQSGDIVENSVYRISLTFSYVTGTSSATLNNYLKLGSTKVILGNAGVNLTDGTTGRSTTHVYYIHGTAAASGSAGVVCSQVYNLSPTGAINSVTQPVSIATNTTVPVIPGVTYSATGSTETFELEAFIIERVN